YREPSIIPNIDVVVARTISFALPHHLNILAGSGDDAFQDQRAGSPDTEPPSFLNVDGGGGNNSLSTSDSPFTTYTLQPGSLVKGQIIDFNDMGVAAALKSDHLSFNNMGSVTIDDSAPSAPGVPGFPQPFYTFHVLGTGASTTTNLLGSPGATNTFNVTDASSIQGPVQIQGGGTDN